MTCGEFLKTLQEYPDAELVFEQIIKPQDETYKLAKVLDNLILFPNDNKVIISHNPFR